MRDEFHFWREMAALVARARSYRRTRRAVEALPAEIRRDIGWRDEAPPPSLGSGLWRP